jgi:hypothetical protein
MASPPPQEQQLPAAAAAAAAKRRKPKRRKPAGECRLHLFTQQILWKDIESTSGLNFLGICNLRPELYGQPGTALRKAVAKQYQYFKKLKRDHSRYEQHVMYVTDFIVLEPAAEKEQDELLSSFDSNEGQECEQEEEESSDQGESEQESELTTNDRCGSSPIMASGGGGGGTSTRSSRSSRSSRFAAMQEDIKLFRQQANTLQDQQYKIDTLESIDMMQSSVETAIRILEAFSKL